MVFFLTMLLLFFWCVLRQFCVLWDAICPPLLLPADSLVTGCLRGLLLGHLGILDYSYKHILISEIQGLKSILNTNLMWFWAWVGNRGDIFLLRSFQLFYHGMNKVSHSIYC